MQQQNSCGQHYGGGGDIPPNVSDTSRANDFYNTPGLEGKELDDAIVQAKTQQDAVLAFFKKRPGYEFTPFEVWTLLRVLRPDLVHELTPVTSIRRAMTNLTICTPRLLVKTENQKPERLGKPNYTWKLYVPEPIATQTKMTF